MRRKKIGKSMRSLERCSATEARGLITWQKSTMVFRLRELWLTPKQLRSYGIDPSPQSLKPKCISRVPLYPQFHI